MNVVQDIVLLLRERDIPPADWPATMALAYVMAGMTVMEHASNAEGPERAREALLAMVDEVRGAIEGWTPGVDVATQLSARFYGGLHES